MKKLKAINTIVLAFLLMIGMASFTTGEKEQVSTSELSSSWTLIKTVDGVQFFAIITDCHDEQNGLHHQVAYFKVKNTNNYAVTVDYNRATWIAGNAADKGQSPENAVQLNLAANQEVKGTCDYANKMRVFVKDLTHTEVPATTHFALTNITVEKR